MEHPMSQAEMQKLLYGALSSGSDEDHAHQATPAARLARDKSEGVPTGSTPSDVIAIYDFRVRTAAQAR